MSQENSLKQVICLACQKNKTLDKFPKARQNKSGYRGICKECRNSWWREWYSRNKEKACLKSKLWAKNNPEAKRNRELKALYGISLNEYIALQNKQNSQCLICNSKPKKLVVDHCHETNKVRGLLCSNCNVLLGLAKDNPQILKNAEAYLNEFKRTSNSISMDRRETEV